MALTGGGAGSGRGVGVPPSAGCRWLMRGLTLAVRTAPEVLGMALPRPSPGISGLAGGRCTSRGPGPLPHLGLTRTPPPTPSPLLLQSPGTQNYQPSRRQAQRPEDLSTRSQQAGGKDRTGGRGVLIPLSREAPKAAAEARGGARGHPRSSRPCSPECTRQRKPPPRGGPGRGGAELAAVCRVAAGWGDSHSHLLSPCLPLVCGGEFSV